MHTVPENGFTTNKLILKLLNEQPSEVYRGKNAEELKDTLKNIEGLANNIIERLENGVDDIKEHCYNLRSKLLQSHETTIRQLNRFYESMLLQVNKYEKETVDQFVNRNDNKTRLIKLIDEVSVFHHDWTTYLKRLSIDDDQVAKSKKIAEGIKIKLEVERQQLDGYIFNEKLMKFEKNHIDITQNLLGSMGFEKLLVQITDNSDLTNSNKTFQKIYLKETIKGYFAQNNKSNNGQINGPFIHNFGATSCSIPQKSIKVNKVKLLDNGKIVVSITNNTEHFTTLLLFTKNGEFMSESKDERFISRLEVATNRNFIVAFFSLGHQRKDQAITTQTGCQFNNNTDRFGFNNQSTSVNFKNIKILDEFFNTIKKININFDVVSINANDSKIFCLTESQGYSLNNSSLDITKLSLNKQTTSGVQYTNNTNNSGLIKIYNWELGLLKSIGQNVNPDVPYYIETPIYQILVTKGKIFLRKENVVSIIDEKFGKLVSKLECNYKLLTNGSNSNIIAISRDSDRLIYLSPNGVKFCEKRLVDFPVNLQPIVESNNTISFFDKDDLILYKSI
jgi:hypothetical protein